MTPIMKDYTQLFKQFQDNEGFKRWMTDTVLPVSACRSIAMICSVVYLFLFILVIRLSG